MDIETIVKDAGIDLEVYNEWVAINGHDEEEDNTELFQDAYYGSFDTLKEWAYDWIEGIYGKGNADTEWLLKYFDYDQFIYDCECGGDIEHFVFNGRTHVFRQV